MTTRSLFIFNRDLRISDHTVLRQACANSDQIMFLFCLQPWEFSAPYMATPAMGQARWEFLQQSLLDLDRALARHGHHLVVRFGCWHEAVKALLDEHEFTHVYHSHSVGFYERTAWQQLAAEHPALHWVEDHTTTLLAPDQLPFAVADLPKHFTPFRKQVEALELQTPVGEPSVWPAAMDSLNPPWLPPEAQQSGTGDPRFQGGQQAGLAHLAAYMNSELPGTYKQVRNELLGWQHSTKLSPWLALGCVSPRQVMQALQEHEKNHTANESTYWIYFELLWREFFQWNAVKQAHALFHNSHPKSFDAAMQRRFKAWCHGQTGVGLIDACMRQLRQTGYLSNRGRQIAASYLIHEAAVDWRAGAAHFERHLVDYDVGSNWGNWQYIAGDGADPRGGRHFNIEKQQRTHDPAGHFVQRWAAAKVDTEAVTWATLQGE